MVKVESEKGGDMGELKGKRAIVTGGASGIGRAIVERFVRAGAQVVIADCDVPRGEALAAGLGEAARFFAVDVSRREEVEALVAFAVDTFGGLEIMVNNAGIVEPLAKTCWPTISPTSRG
ncbi:MAG: hypothetical protein KatS3mg124_0645 [Porticoccaceae bacterium]|nr:MAG: hypothetical protein KatS3mg124_0645 [Porticoccaceae bacterium]